MIPLQVYPLIWEEGETEFEYFSELQKLYSEAVNNNQAIISIINLGMLNK
ncbi:MAG: hypothetical protein ACI94Y_003200 [Maribacter sp.]|jgi:hypothetical protein